MFYSICLENTVIGYIVLHKEKDGYDIGYCFHPDYHRKGYAKESISGLLNYLRSKGFCRITAVKALENILSVKLLLSLGFKQIGTEKVSFLKMSKEKILSLMEAFMNYY